MTAKRKNKKKKLPEPYPFVKVDGAMYVNDPFFVKKREDATAFLKKHGLPDYIVPKNK